MWNTRNTDGRPEDYLPHELLDRCSFVGVDLYQNRSSEGYAERLGPILAWLDSRGFSRLMIGACARVGRGRREPSQPVRSGHAVARDFCGARRGCPAAQG